MYFSRCIVIYRQVSCDYDPWVHTGCFPTATCQLVELASPCHHVPFWNCVCCVCVCEWRILTPRRPAPLGGCHNNTVKSIPTIFWQWYMIGLRVEILFDTDSGYPKDAGAGYLGKPCHVGRFTRSSRSLATWIGRDFRVCVSNCPDEFRFLRFSQSNKWDDLCFSTSVGRGCFILTFWTPPPLWNRICDPNLT